MSIQYPMVSWAKKSNIYEVNIRQYTPSGTFRELAEHLERLKDMHAGILWLMPITPIAEQERLGSLGSYYACKSYVNINPEYGTKEDFTFFVEKAHSIGLKIIIDWVANHTGYGHEWTVNHPEWFLLDKAGNFTERNGWKDVIDLNYANREMQQAMIAAMKYWITDCNIDGFRCDMAHLVPLNFWHEARRECEKIKSLFWLGECDDAAYSEVFDVTYAWKWMHDSKDFIDGKTNAQAFLNTVYNYESLPKGALKSYFTSNHDENSWNGTEYEKYGSAALAMSAYTLLLNGIPIIYSGQELPNYKRLKFFDKDEILWQDRQLPKLHYYYKGLLSLRHTKVFDADAKLELKALNNHLIYMNREKGSSRMIALFNFSKEENMRVHLTDDMSGVYSNLSSGISYIFKEEEYFNLHPGEYLVYTKNINQEEFVI